MNDLVKLGYLKNTTSPAQAKRGNIRYEKNYINAYYPHELCWYESRGLYQGGSTKYLSEDHAVNTILREIFLPNVYRISKATKQFFESMEPLFKDKIEGKYNPDLSVFPENYPMKKFLETFLSVVNISPEEKSNIIFTHEIVYKGSYLGEETPRLKTYYETYLDHYIEYTSLDKESLSKILDLYLMVFPDFKEFTYPKVALIDHIFENNDFEAFKYVLSITNGDIINKVVIPKKDDYITLRSIKVVINSFYSWQTHYTSGTLLDKLDYLYTYCSNRGETDGHKENFDIVPPVWIRLAKLYHYNFNKVISILKSTDEEIKNSFDDLDDLDEEEL